MPNVAGRLDAISDEIDQLITDWTQTLLNTIDDPLVLDQKQYLDAPQQKLIDDFVGTKKLPEHVDESFVSAIESLLKGFEPVYVDGRELVDELVKLGPCTADDFKKKLAGIISSYTRGKDTENLRIIVRSE